MFWLRPTALRLLLDAHLEVADFEAEVGQLDGTLAHAVERVFSLAAAPTASARSAWPACSVTPKPAPERILTRSAAADRLHRVATP